MSFDDIIIKITSFDNLISYISETAEYNEADTTTTTTNTTTTTITITIYHIHIGAKTFISTHINHNHELTDFLKTLYYKTFAQFSPDFISQLMNYPEIKIRNIVILIDPIYKTLPILEGFKELSDNYKDNGIIPRSISNEIVIQHCNDTITSIMSCIEIIQVPIDITEQDIIKLVNILDTSNKSKSRVNNMMNNIMNNMMNNMLINIMDCTSRVLLKLYAYYSVHDTVFITRPDCLKQDTLPLHKPVITIGQVSEQVSVRWINYNDDKKIILDLEQVSDICYNSKITYTFLVETYKHNIAFETLISIFKLWSRLSYTNIQEILKSQSSYDYIYGGNDHSHDEDHHSHDRNIVILSVKFCDLSFTEFITYWKQYPQFSDFILFNIDDYYKHNLKIFLDKFIFKYEDVASHLTIIEALQIESIDIFKTLISIKSKNNSRVLGQGQDDSQGSQGIDSIDIIQKNGGINCIFEDESRIQKLLERKHILDYLKSNNINL